VGIGDSGVVMPEFELAVSSGEGGQAALRFTLLYGCSHGDAVTIAQTTHDPVIVVRDGLDSPATYFIYSWDETAEQVVMAADAENFVPVQRIPVPDRASVVYPSQDSRTG
jgi:hypothetical protein